jgi:DnaJ-class molecular chaperone
MTTTECPRCEGTGEVATFADDPMCPKCGGSGRIVCPDCKGRGTFGPVYLLTGKLWIPEGPCRTCGGSGRVPAEPPVAGTEEAR